MFRRLAALVAPFLLSGCIVSDIPAITPATAEDVGQRLDYTIYAQGAWRETEFIALTRHDGMEYQLNLGQTGGPLNAFANGISVRALGERAGEEVILIQFDLANFERDPDITPEELGFGYMYYPLSIDSDGRGAVGKIDCDNIDAHGIAAGLGVELGCRDIDGNPFVSITSGDPDGIWAFLTHALGADLFRWEDETGEGALDWVE